jgi:hypothetical protein
LQESHISFTCACKHRIVRKRPKRRYGAILWHASADIDNAIRLVKTFDDPEAAVRLLATICADGERWAVVDLTTMRAVATGSTPHLFRVMER